MGRILRCSSKIANKPLYFPGIGINIYTGEELAYCIERNLYMITEAFFDDKLKRFLGIELGYVELADYLDTLIARYGIYAAAGEIVFAVGDLDAATRARLEKKILEYQNMSKEERRKLEADNLIKTGDILKAVCIYQELLEKPEKFPRGKLGEIYLSLAKVALDDFSWEQAESMFEQAYHYLEKEAILKQLFAISYLTERDQIPPIVEKYVAPSTLANWIEDLKKLDSSIEESLDAEEDKVYDGEEELEREKALLKEWKRDFRKIHKISCQTIDFSV